MKPRPHAPEFGIAPRAFLALLAAGPALAQTTERVSLDPSGAELWFTAGMDISDNGDLVAFIGTPVGGPGLGLYLRSLSLDATVLLSATGVQEPAISGDGGDVAATTSFAFAGDTNGTNDIYVWPTSGGAPVLASVTNAGGLSNAPSWDCDLSEDGNAVVFMTYGPNNLTANPIPLAGRQVYLSDLSAGTTTLLSVTPGGSGGNSTSDFPQISDDGLFVAFQSDASDLVAGDVGGRTDIFVFDVASATVALVSRNDTGVQSDGFSTEPRISADGRFILYRSTASNLGGGLPPFIGGLYLLDRDPNMNGDFTDTAGVTTLVSVSSLGVPVAFGGIAADLSDDGSRVLFWSLGYTYEPNPNDFNQAWLHDRTTGQTTNVHIDSAGHRGNGSVLGGIGGRGNWLALSGDGETAVYRTTSTDLDPLVPDTNGQEDVYAHHVCENPAIELGFWLAGTDGTKPEFTVCGGLGTGQTAEFRLKRALPGATCRLVLSPTSRPIPICGSAWVPAPVPFVPPFAGRRMAGPAQLPSPPVTADALGEVTITFTGGGGPYVRYAQWVIDDPGGCMGRAFSNALEIRWDP